MHDLIAGQIAQVNAGLPHGLSVARFANLHKEFDPDDGEVTRTRKLKRNVIDDRYGPIIEALNAGADQIDFRAQITYENGQTGSLDRVLRLADVEAA